MHNEARIALRRPAGLVGGIIPILLLVVFGELPSFKTPVPSFGGYSPFDVYVPILVVFSLAMFALMALPVPLASYRELGVLRRLSTTPVPPSWVLAAQGLVQVCLALTTFLLVIVVSITAFGAPVPRNISRAGGVVRARGRRCVPARPVLRRRGADHERGQRDRPGRRSSR